MAVGGPIATIIDGYCKGFQQETGIAVEPVYAGDYSQTLIKALTAIKSGAGPQFSVLWASEIHSLVDQDILVALDDIGLDADAKRWLDQFYPVFMANSHAEGKTCSALPAFDGGVLLQQGRIRGRRSESRQVPYHLG